jgi:death on curing protein
MSDPVWIPFEVVVWVHNQQAAFDGGEAGLWDKRLLESALAGPREAYASGEDDPCALAALYAAGIARKRPFIQGNARSAFLVCDLFLRANAALLDAPDAECIALACLLDAGEINDLGFAEWLRERVRIA